MKSGTCVVMLTVSRVRSRAVLLSGYSSVRRLVARQALRRRRLQSVGAAYTPWAYSCMYLYSTTTIAHTRRMTHRLTNLLLDVDGAPVLKDGVHLRRAEAHFDPMRECFNSVGLQTTKVQPPAPRWLTSWEYALIWHAVGSR